VPKITRDGPTRVAPLNARDQIRWSSYIAELERGELSAANQKLFASMLKGQHQKKGRPPQRLKAGYWQYVGCIDEMVNSHTELGTRSPTHAAFEELASAEGRDVETIKKYFRMGVQECRPHEARTAMQIHALIQDLTNKGVADPQQAALEKFAKDLGKTPLIVRRIYVRGRKPGK
jgi:hypothetical protein